MSGEFDPINDYDSNYGRVLGTQLSSKYATLKTVKAGCTPKTLHPKPSTLNLDTPTPNPKTQTLNPKPQTLNPQP